jgi:hypothetical protein
LRGEAPNLVAAAAATGSCTQHVAAALVLLNSENAELQNAVLSGSVSLLEGAEMEKRLARALTAYRALSANEHVLFGGRVGPAALWDGCLVPSL